eukprot:COSAG01_NODE_208_length_21996_cov_31.972097_13_plen_103_part_00
MIRSFTAPMDTAEGGQRLCSFGKRVTLDFVGHVLPPALAVGDFDNDGVRDDQRLLLSTPPPPTDASPADRNSHVCPCVLVCARVCPCVPVCARVCPCGPTGQ